MLLWNFTIRLHDNPPPNLEHVARDLYVEAGAALDSLNQHNCDLDLVLMYMCREYLFKYA